MADRRWPRWDGRARWLILLIGLTAALLLLPSVHDRLLAAIDSAGDLIRQQPLAGMLVFVLLAAASAMLAFLSSAVLIPVAVHVWGPAVCVLLLWIGWYLGGIGSYAVGRYLGRPMVERLVRRNTLARYEGWARSGPALVPILLVQLAIPSDIAGYLFGLVRCRLRLFLLALAIAEVPYAVGAVYLGVSFLQRNLIPLLVLGLAGVGLSVWALRRLHSPPPDPGAPASLPAPEPGSRG